MAVALADSNSGKLLTEGYDQDVLKAGESMHQLWRGHEQDRGGNVTSYGTGGFAKLDQSWLQALDLNFVDIVLNVLDSRGLLDHAMTIPAGHIIDASLDEATNWYQATNAKGAETNANWTKVSFTTDADKVIQSGITGEWTTPIKNDKKKRGVVES